MFPTLHHIPICPFSQRLEILLELEGRTNEVRFSVATDEALGLLRSGSVATPVGEDRQDHGVLTLAQRRLAPGTTGRAEDCEQQEARERTPDRRESALGPSLRDAPGDGPTEDGAQNDEDRPDQKGVGDRDGEIGREWGPLGPAISFSHVASGVTMVG